MPTTSNFNFPTPADTDLVKDGASAIRSLGNSIDTAFVDLKGGTTDQVLAKNSNTDLDFKWVAQDDSNAIQNAIVDAKGDLISATGADTPARLAVGANDTVLTADSSTSTGLKWASPASGGMTLLSTTSLTGASVTISSISQDYNELVLYLEDVVPATDSVDLLMRVNGATGSVYTAQASMTNLESSSTYATSYKVLQEAGNNANDWCNVKINIPNYTAAYYKVWNVLGHYANKNSDAAPPFWSLVGAMGGYAATTAISSITFLWSSGNFSTGSVKLYGVK